MRFIAFSLIRRILHTPKAIVPFREVIDDGLLSRILFRETNVAQETSSTKKLRSSRTVPSERCKPLMDSCQIVWPSKVRMWIEGTALSEIVSQQYHI